MEFFKRMLGNCRGVAVAEYGLIAAVAGVAIAVASLTLGSASSSALRVAASCDQAGRC